jgi:uncharacterized membrane protein
LIFGIVKYLGKLNEKCGMCHEIKYTEKYLWIGFITQQKLSICAKCAEREGGKKVWKEKSQQIKKLSQK